MLFAVLYIVIIAGAHCDNVFGDQNETSSCKPISLSGNDPCNFARLNNRTFYQPLSTLPNFDHIQIMQLITKTYERNTNCSSHIVSLVCNYLYPPCTEDDEPRPLCTLSCNKLTQELCHTEWKRLLAIAMESTLLRPLVNKLNCVNTYYNNDNHNYTSVSNCWSADTNVPIATTNLDNQQFAIILSLIFAFEILLLLISIGITVIVVRKLRRWKTTINKANYLNVLPGHQTLTRSTENGTLRNIVLLGSLINQNKKIQGQRMLLENVPLLYMDIMSQYVNYLLQEDKLQLIKFLADGVSTEVYQGSYSESQSYGTSLTHFVAVKRFKDPINDETILKYIEQCLKLTEIDHPNVLKLKGLSFGAHHRLLIVSPYFSQHNLLTYLRMFRMQNTSDNKQVVNPVEHLINMIKQISSGMKSLAENDFTYKMLSSETCLVDSEGNVFIGDLSYLWFVSNQAALCTVWNAPEIRPGSTEHSEKSDVWSFGVTALEILNMGGLPAPSSTATVDNNDWLQKPAICPQLLYDLLLKCLDEDPQKRPNFTSIVSQLDTLMNNESFTSEVLNTHLPTNDTYTTTLYGPYGYLKILPDNPIEQDYLYTVSRHGFHSTTTTTNNALNTPSPNPPVISIDTISQSNENYESDDDGYVHVSPSCSNYSLKHTKSPPNTSSFTPPQTSTFSLPTSAFSPLTSTFSPPSPLTPAFIGGGSPNPRASPIPQFSERPDSEESDKEEEDFREYYNLHFKPIVNSSSKKSSETRNKFKY